MAYLTNVANGLQTAVGSVANRIRAVSGNEQAQTVELGKRRFTQSKKRKANLIGPWQTYQKYLEADQWSEAIKKSDWRSDPVTNIMFRIKEHMVAVLTSENPVVTATPVGPDDDDKGKLVSDLLGYIAEITDQDEMLEEALDTAVSLGTAVAHVTWDNSIHGGNPPGVDPMGNPTPGTLWVGNIKVSIIDPANFFPGPGYTIEEAPWHIIAYPRNVEDVKADYPDAQGIDNLKPESGFSETEIYGSNQWDSEDGMVMFYTMYSKNPEGGIDLLEWAGNVILRDEKQFYSFDTFPLASLTFWRRRKQFFGMGVPQQIISQQKARNKLQALMIESALKTGSPQYTYDASSGIDANNWTDEPSLRVPVNGNPANAIHLIQQGLMPTYIPDQLPQIDEGMKWVTGHTDAFTGGPDAGTTTAAGILAQHQSAAAFMKGPEKRMFRFLEDLAEVELAFVKTFYTEERLIRLNAQDGSEVWQWFDATAIQDMDFDLKAEAGPSNPMSKVYVAAQAEKLLDKGQITLEEYLDVVDFPIKEKILQRIADQKAQAQALQAAQVGAPPGGPPIPQIPPQPPQQGGFLMP